MHRILCLRFPNWTVQATRYRLRDRSTLPEMIAVHTPLPTKAAAMPPKPSRRTESGRTEESDWVFIRELFPASRTGPTIVAVNEQAWKNGIRPGMPLAEARSMAMPPAKSARPGQTKHADMAPRTAECEFVEWQPEQDRSLLIQTAELTRRFAPIVAIDTLPVPDCLLLDITGCAPLFGGESTLSERLLQTLRQAGFQTRLAIADTVSAAWAIAHADLPGTRGSASPRHRKTTRISTSLPLDLPVQISVPGSARMELESLPVAAGRLPLNDLELLMQLGIRTLGQLLALPLSDLPARLSELSVRRIQQLLEIEPEHPEPLPEADPITAVWSQEEPACGIADLKYIIAGLCPQMAEQLERRRMGCIELKCTIRFSDQSDVQIGTSLVKATQSPELLADVLTLRLEHLVSSAIRNESRQTPASSPGSVTASTKQQETVRPQNPDESNDVPANELLRLISEPVIAVRITAGCSLLPTARQKDLFHAEDHIEHEEELGALISRLSGRLGAESVLTVSNTNDPRPEHTVQYVPSAKPTKQPDRLSHSSLTALTQPSDNANSSLPDLWNTARPLRLFAEPMALSIPRDQTPGSTVSITITGQTYDLAHWSTAERIQTGWWTEFPCHRDYFRVETSGGNRLWIFRDLTSGHWFLHGWFD